jgi:hypothetical protein
MNTITTKDGMEIYYKDGATRRPRRSFSRMGGL